MRIKLNTHRVRTKLLLGYSYSYSYTILSFDLRGGVGLFFLVSNAHKYYGSSSVEKMHA